MQTMKKSTAIIVVDEIEPCLPFWTERLGFELTGTVPHEDAMGFAMLNSGGVDLMYQSRASVEADLGSSGGPAGLAGELAASTTTLFVEVADLDAVITDLGDEVEVLVARRQTFYGMDELFVRAPCGTVVGFATTVAEGAADE
jgi:uncharacterized glyoxalase superfamily protein PhnB